MGKTADPLQYVKISLILTAGTAFLLWLGDQITNKGIGNGISLIIMAGIINTVPGMMIEAFKNLVVNNTNMYVGILAFVIFILLYISLIVFISANLYENNAFDNEYSNLSAASWGVSLSAIG